MNTLKAVELNNVSYHYPDGVEALININLTIQKKEKDEFLLIIKS